MNLIPLGFHTIKSILNIVVNTSVIIFDAGFHTIKSILNSKEFFEKQLEYIEFSYY